MWNFCFLFTVSLLFLLSYFDVLERMRKDQKLRKEILKQRALWQPHWELMRAGSGICAKSSPWSSFWPWICQFLSETQTTVQRNEVTALTILTFKEWGGSERQYSGPSINRYFLKSQSELPACFYPLPMLAGIIRKSSITTAIDSHSFLVITITCSNVILLSAKVVKYKD